MKYLPGTAILAVEALLASYADGKYRRPKWRERSAESHALAALRHLAAGSRELADAESGRPHSEHAMARAAFSLAREQEAGREPPDPIEFALALLHEATNNCLALDDAGAAWNPYRAIAYEIASLFARLNRIHESARKTRDGGIAWDEGTIDEAGRS